MDILDTIPKKVVFRQRGTPIEPEMRPLWRMALISLILLNLSSGLKSGSKKIQVLCSLISSPEKMESYFSGSKDLFFRHNVRFDPLVDRAIDLGLAEHIFELEPSKSIKLSNKGLVFANTINADTEVFVKEKEFMKKFNKSFFTDQVIEKIISGETL